MIVETSAVVAILRGEPEATTFVKAILAAERSFIVAPSMLEINMVLVGSRLESAKLRVDQFYRHFNIKVIAFTPQMADAASEAFLKYGKDRGHPAQLNFGDCIAYAASKCEAMPLLFKGEEFRLTDVDCAV